MNRRLFTSTLLTAVAGAGCGATNRIGSLPRRDPLLLDPSRYTAETIEVNCQTVRFRAYEGRPVVARAVEPEYQAINLYVPEAYFRGERVGGFDARTAPIFLPNGVGGYMPAKPGALAGRGEGLQGQPTSTSASAMALWLGYVVAAPGARGRTLRATDGRWTGKAPAAIVDLKAAVRWLRHNAGRIPGDPERIVSNGTSAGGALSALLGASGNHPDYAEDLEALGAAPARDDIHAVSAYCPITNLAHADEAYEWQFEGIREYRNVALSMLDFRVQRREVVGQLNDAQLTISAELRSNFVAYVNSLGLCGPDGSTLALRPDGSGSLREHVSALVRASAQRALDAGQGVAETPWLAMHGDQIAAVDFRSYARGVGRMKSQPAFDGFALETGENQLFGDAGIDKRHFTAYSMRHSQSAGARLAPAATVRAMDAMQQLSDARSTVARHWRIRHGTLDRDTSLAVPALLAAAARQRGASVDLALPWGRPHSGDYDLDELFAWVQFSALR